MACWFPCIFAIGVVFPFNEVMHFSVDLVVFQYLFYLVDGFVIVVLEVHYWFFRYFRWCGF